MRPTAIPTTLLLALACLPLSTRAHAQTLRVDVDMDLEADLEPSPAGPRVDAQVGAGEAAPPVVVVVPLEETAAEDPAPRAVFYEDVPYEDVPYENVPYENVPPPSHVTPATVETPEPRDEDLQGWSAFGAWAEGMDLSSLDFDLSHPEITALAGTQLGPAQGLGTSTVGGVLIGLGLRTEGILRAPELRLILGGGDTGGAWTRVDGSSLEVQTRGLFIVQVEAAMGVQVELGPVVPYVLARASVGGAFLDVNVRDDRLGRLGTEHADALLLQAGIEAGVEIHTHDGLVVGGAFRGSFAGTPSYGGVLSLGFVSE